MFEFLELVFVFGGLQKSAACSYKVLPTGPQASLMCWFTLKSPEFLFFRHNV